ERFVSVFERHLAPADWQSEMGGVITHGLRLPRARRSLSSASVNRERPATGGGPGCRARSTAPEG
ncbi:MAG: hypothetical protein LC799_01675, partial [Actinobacteria bacterium]|nr:hypothetical protein [Actinomycetota bacterium]